MDFWTYHGLGFIFCMFFFPRLTMLFATTVGSGALYWLGWFIAPRLTVAIIATSYFWQTNVILCILTWMWALAGESTEKTAIKSST
jgi:hypothetical protein